MRRSGWLALLLLLAPGCDGTLGGGADGAVNADGGGGLDSGAADDAGPAREDAAATDAGTGADDAGPSDAGARDAGPSDAGAPLADAGPPPIDAGPGCVDVSTAAGAFPDGPIVPIGGAFRNYRPHYGSRAHGHASCSYYHSNTLPDWAYSSSWGTGCHQTRYYYLDSSITSRAGWTDAAIEAFKNWDIPTACTPHWVRTTDPARAHVTVLRSDRSGCSGPGTGWYACAWSGWSITLNSAHDFRIGVNGYLDVESIITVELAHVVHFGHSPNWADSVSQANTGRWGSASSSVPSADSCGFTPYTVCVPGGSCAYPECPPVSEGGCGNFRTLRPGDFALAQHIAGVNPSPPHAYDDGSGPGTTPARNDLAMLYATSDGAGMYDWLSNGSGAFTLRTSRWAASGFPLDRVGDRMVAGDFDGDGDDDVATAMQMCDGTFRFHVWRAGSGSLAYQGDAGWYTSGSFTLSRVGGRMVAGDFDGDGTDDVAMFYRNGGSNAILHVWTGEGTRFAYRGVWWEVASGYELNNVGDRFVAGDFDGDGDDDVATAYQYGDGTFRFHVWRSNGSSFVYAGASGWYQSGTYSLAGVAGRLAAGDVSGDGRDDVVMLRTNGTSGAMLWLWTSTGSSFALAPTRWSVESGYGLSNVGDRFVVTDVNRDGRADAVTAYQYGDGTFRYHVWTSSGTTFAYGGAGGWYTSGPFDLSRVGGRLVAGNWNAD